MSEPVAPTGTVGSTAPLKVPNENSVIIPRKQEDPSQWDPDLWAIVPYPKIQALASMATDERWDYDNQGGDAPSYRILRSYLQYTFKRLVYEGKLLIGEDKNGYEIASFNTGLVDKKYDYIYAIFKKDSGHDNVYWYLYDFAPAGEGAGKILVSVFNPLPQKADYFKEVEDKECVGNKVINLLYDTNADLVCDYEHILTERIFRFPKDFLVDECGEEFLTIDGVSINDVFDKPERDEDRKSYFEKLGEKIGEDSNKKILRRLRNRMEDAVELAIKRVEWNYKTAIPTYYPPRNVGSLLLPLALVEDDHVDLALVVERQPSGSYQGQTVLPLHLAYSNSRLVSRPDSDWLNVEKASMRDTDELDDDE